MKIMASNVNQHKKAPAFNAILAESGKLAEIIPASKLDEFKKELIKPETQQRISDIKIFNQNPLIYVSNKTKNIIDGVESQISAFYDGIEQPEPFTIGKNMSGNDIVESFIESIGNAVEKIRKAL